MDLQQEGWQENHLMSWSYMRDRIRCVKFNSDDVPPRFELFLLDDGQQKVEYKEETREYILHLHTTFTNLTL